MPSTAKASTRGEDKTPQDHGCCSCARSEAIDRACPLNRTRSWRQATARAAVTRPTGAATHAKIVLPPVERGRAYPPRTFQHGSPSSTIERYAKPHDAQREKKRSMGSRKPRATSVGVALCPWTAWAARCGNTFACPHIAAPIVVTSALSRATTSYRAFWRASACIIIAWHCWRLHMERTNSAEQVLRRRRH